MNGYSTFFLWENRPMTSAMMGSSFAGPQHVSEEPLSGLEERSGGDRD
jgi:hypothetical protein